MRVNDEIYAKAKRIIEERNKSRAYIQTCLEAGICPICGDALISKDGQATTDYKCTSCEYRDYTII
jgi:tRNA(Ile2) C34 agmatinyltransferase TiaS